MTTTAARTVETRILISVTDAEGVAVSIRTFKMADGKNRYYVSKGGKPVSPDVPFVSMAEGVFLEYLKGATSRQDQPKAPKEPVPEGLASPEGDKRGPNCGVTAVAIMAGVPFSTAMEATCAARRRRGRPSDGRWKGGTTYQDRQLALKALGYETVEMPLPRRMSLKTFVQQYARPGVRYMVRTTRHVQVVKDGLVSDQNQQAVPVTSFRLKGKIVTKVNTVEPIKK